MLWVGNVIKVVLAGFHGVSSHLGAGVPPGDARVAEVAAMESSSEEPHEDGEESDAAVSDFDVD